MGQRVRARVNHSLVVAGLILSQVLLLLLMRATPGAQSNPVVIENQQPGSTGWDPDMDHVGTDAVGQIKGYASAVSVNKGQSITLFVSVNPAQTYTIDIYRVGYYQGLGGRLMQHIGPLNGVKQPGCPVNPTYGTIECNWAASYTLAIPTSWTSGIYIGTLINAAGFKNYLTFVVRDDSRLAALIYQQPVATYQADNNWPNDGQTGKSTYDYTSYGAVVPTTGHKSASKVSYDRPYLDSGIGNDFNGDTAEINFVRWMERNGYDVVYSTDLDTHANGNRLLNYRGFLTAGHDEYWSKQMFDSVAAARNAGVNLGFFTGNSIYWQIRMESSSTGVPNRVLVCYKDYTLDPIVDKTQATVLWRGDPVNRPEQTLMGVQYTVSIPQQDNQGFYPSFVVQNSSHWVYSGTGFTNGSSVRGLIGYETDRFFSNEASPATIPGTYILLSNSPWGTGTDDHSNSSIYQAPSGAWVYTTGAMAWNYGLDDYGHGYNIVDTRIQRTAANVLDRFVSAQPPPGVNTVTPANGTTVGGTALNIQGANFVSGATVSIGGNAATGVTVVNSSTITATTPAHAAGSVNVIVTNPDGKNGTLPNGFTYVSTAPAINSVAPSAGPTTGGTTITLTGLNFATGATVTIGGTAATGVTVVNSTTITANTPPHAAGAVNVTVTNTDTQSGTITAGFTYLLPAPTISNVAPSSGPTQGGTAITITGTNFAAGATVSVGGTAATGVTVVNSTTITALTPLHVQGIVSVTVTNPDTQAATRVNSFTYTVSAPAPTLTSIAPTTGPGSGATAITITGTGFAAGATVSLGGTAATGVTVVNTTTITATTPAHASGLVSVTVTNADVQSATLANSFTYTAPLGVAFDAVGPNASGVAASGVASLSWTHPVTSTGFNRLLTAAVAVGKSPDTGLSLAATSNGVSMTSAGVVHSNGVTDGFVQLFYLVNPASGTNTIQITVTGGTAALEGGSVSFTGVDQTTPVRNVTTSTGSSASPRVTVTSVPGNMVVDAMVTGCTGTMSSIQTLRWLKQQNCATAGGNGAQSTAAGAASVTMGYAVPSDYWGMIGMDVIAAGGTPPTFDFTLSNQGNKSVVRGSAVANTVTATLSSGTTQAATFSVTGLPTGVTGSFDTGTCSPTCTTNLTLSASASATLGTSPVTVTAIAGAVTRTTPFNLTVTAPAPTVTSVSPTSGSTSGGTAFTITGTGFATGATVSVGGSAATGVILVNSTTITATTPAHAAGAVSVAVTNADTQSGTLASAFTYVAPAPTLTSVTPSSGSTGGSTAITISGTGFVAGATVSVGGSAATGVTVVNSTTITATTPAHAAGAVSVTVTNADAQSGTLATAFTYAIPAPTVTSVAPTSGPIAGSTAITITGTGFAAGATVSVGGSDATGVTVVNSTTITATTPAHAAGAVSVTVTNADTQSGTRANAFTYLGPAPTITSVSPTSGAGAGGTAITITGTGFAAGATVSVGGTAATGVTVVDATTITATTPAHAAGAVGVTVTNADTQSGSLASAFTYLAAAPTVTSVAPTSGSTAGGTALTITGTGFVTGATVSMGGNPVSGIITVVNSTRILIGTTPAHAAGPVSLTVTNPDTQSGTLANAFTYVVAPPPTVTGVAPASGPPAGGTAVTITGTNFSISSATTVSVDGSAATNVSVVNSTTITATMPPHAAGAASVTVTNDDTQSGTLANAFTYVTPAPTVTTVTPTSGPTAGGTAITVTGTGFAAGATVSVGGSAATGVTVVNGTTITATTPVHAAGAVSVTVTNADAQSGTRANAFTYLAPAPTVTSVTPTSGPTAGGTAITIGGTGFSTGATVSVGGTAATGVTVVDSTTITATTPAHAAGAVGVMVTNADAQSGTRANAFTYMGPAPTVTSVAPATGSTNGGTALTISGTGFAAGATVSVGGTAATGVTVVNSTTITATAPAHAAGAVSVTVTNTDTQSATLATAFTYVTPAPTVTSVAPTSGSIAGGTAITITGTGFVAGATVSVAGDAATGVTVVNGTTITATTPAHAAGAVGVTVTNADAQSGTRANAFTYLAPAPTVASVSPTSGPTSGGTAITIAGSGFAAGATVSVGGTAATGVTVVDAATITATTPAHAAGAVSVTVTNADAQSGTRTNAFTYIGPAPTMTSVTPSSGSTLGGTAITIAGTGFAAGATVSVGGSAATGVTVVNSTTITAATPAHAVGAVSVTVTNVDTQSATLATAFTYVVPIATVAFDAVGPAAGGASVNGSSLSWNHTVTTTGSNLLLTVGVAVGKAGDAGLSLAVTYGGVPMTSAGLVHSNNRSDGFVQLFYLKAPPTGTNAVQVTLTGGTATMEGGSVSFTGVDQTTPVRNITTKFGTGTGPNVTVASAPGNMVVDALVTGCPGNITSKQTLRWLNKVNCATAGGNGAQSTAAGAASVAMGYTVPNDWWGMIGMDVVAVATPVAYAAPQDGALNAMLMAGGTETTATVQSSGTSNQSAGGSFPDSLIAELAVERPSGKPLRPSRRT